MNVPHKKTDPYKLLMLSVVETAMNDVKYYFFRYGDTQQRASGKTVISWVNDMSGTFDLCAEAAGYLTKDFRDLCNWKIKRIKDRADLYFDLEESISLLREDSFESKDDEEIEAIKKTCSDYRKLMNSLKQG